MEALQDAADQSFLKAKRLFDELGTFVRTSAAAALEHGLVEEEVGKRGMPILCALMQAYVELVQARHTLVQRSERKPAEVLRLRPRTMLCRFGLLHFERLGSQAMQGAKVWYGLDAQLNLPSRHYSHGVARDVILEIIRQSVHEAGMSLERFSSGVVDIGSRQMMEIVQRGAQDIDAFLEKRPRPANDNLTSKALLIGSCDASGVMVRPEALRDATAKQAAEAARVKRRADPMVKCHERQHKMRMAMVTAVWDQEPWERTPQDIQDNLHRTADDTPKPKGPRPQNKCLDASIIDGERVKIIEMLLEMKSRDPKQERPWVIVVDGKTSQLQALEQEAQGLGVEVTIIVDLLHVLHYLWSVAACFSEDATQRELWVENRLEMLLDGKVSRVVREMRKSVLEKEKHQELDSKKRKIVNEAADYLFERRKQLKYKEYLARGMPIASGVIEGACRHLVKGRLGITGARWGLESAEAVLRLRALYLSGLFEEYWAFHIANEKKRNYPENLVA
jgi:hypothetical protein